MDILFIQHNRTKRSKCVTAEKSEHRHDGDAGRGRQGTVIKNRQRKPQSKIRCKATKSWRGMSAQESQGVQEMKGVTENRTQCKYCI